jgi:hypothetical protein
MRKSVSIALSALIVVLLAGTIVLYQTYRKTTMNYIAMKSQAESTQARYGEAINQIASIQDSLNAIDVGDSSVHLDSSQLEAERQLSNTHGDEAIARIADLKASMERMSARIRQLDRSLHVSGIEVAGLKKMIAGLKSTLAGKEAEVAALSVRVDSLETTVTGLATEVQTGRDSIDTQARNLEDQRRELGTIYYCVGTKGDLTRSGVVIAKGGLLGIGKTLAPSTSVSETQFTALDTDRQTVIQIPAAKAQVVSAQPAASYQLASVEGKLELRILDPREFRKIKHLVIVTA